MRHAKTQHSIQHALLEIKECHMIEDVTISKYAKYQPSAINSYKITVSQSSLTHVNSKNEKIQSKVFVNGFLAT